MLDLKVPSHLTRAAVCAAVACLATAILSSSAIAAGFGPSLTVGTDTYVTGEHPNLSLDISKASGENKFKEVQVQLPIGLFPNVASGPYCGLTQAADSTYSCQNPASKIGSVEITVEGLPDPLTASLYLEKPDSGQVANIVGIPDSGQIISATQVLRSSGGLTKDAKRVVLKMTDLPSSYNISEIKFNLYSAIGLDPTKPFFTNPAFCGTNSVEGVFSSQQSETKTVSIPYQFTGCETVQYRPTFSLGLSNSTASQPSSITTDLRIPAEDATTQKVTVSLPANFTLNSGSKTKICSQAQIDSGACPPESEMATVHTTSSLVAGDLVGHIYLGPPVGPDLKIVLTFDALTGVELEGRLVARSDGGIDMVFDNFPPIQTSSMAFHFSKGSQGTFRNPFQCGNYSAYSSFTSYTGVTRSFTHPLVITGCTSISSLPGAKLDAVLVPARAGSFADLRLQVTQDSPGPASSLKLKLPKGLKIDAKKMKKSGSAVAEVWDRSTRLGRATLKPAKRRAITLASKSHQLGVRVKIGKGSLVVSGLPQGKNITDFSVRIFGKQIKAIRAPGECKTAIHFLGQLVQDSTHSLEFSSPQKLGCRKK